MRATKRAGGRMKRQTLVAMLGILAAGGTPLGIEPGRHGARLLMMLYKDTVTCWVIREVYRYSAAQVASILRGIESVENWNGNWMPEEIRLKYSKRHLKGSRTR